MMNSPMMPAVNIKGSGSEKTITTRQVSEAIIGVSGNNGALKGRLMAGYFLCSLIMDRLDQKSTNK